MNKLARQGRSVDSVRLVLGVVGLTALMLLAVGRPADAAPICGDDNVPVPHWVDTCPGGVDRFPSEAFIALDILGDVITANLFSPFNKDTLVWRSDPIDTPDPLDPGHFNKINTELCFLEVTGFADIPGFGLRRVTVRAGDGICNGVSDGPLFSDGMIIEKTGGGDCPFAADPTQACSFFDVFFEVEIENVPPPLNLLHNQVAVTVGAPMPYLQITHVPPTPVGVPPTLFIYIHDGPVQLFNIFNVLEPIVLIEAQHTPNSLSADATAQIRLRQERPGVPDDQFGWVGEFVLPAGDIAPDTEDVTIALSEPTCGDPFSHLVFPAGSCTARSGGKITVCQGVVTDLVTLAEVEATVRIVREGGQRFRVSLDLKDADYTCLEGVDNLKVRTTLMVGTPGAVGTDTMSGSQCFGRTGDGDLYTPLPQGAACP